ncbi:MAG: 60 kDa inner membrane insertion protein [uncultured bacterium]|nr:MAG: 60 kDa inner membrane insertion protein [uncultured bacterium]HLD44210.1 membrane protein insertase YidC [bacterium]
MRQEFRLLSAVVLSTAVFVGYQMFFAPKPPQQPTQTTQQTAVPVEPAQIIQSQQPQSLEIPQGESPSTGEIQAEEKTISVETPLAHITLSTRGAVITDYQLKKFKLKAKKDSPPKNLLPEEGTSSALFLGFKGYSPLTAGKVYRVVSDQELPAGVRTIVLEWQNDSVRIQKTFVFDGTQNNYTVTVAYEVANLSQSDLVLTPYLQNSITQKPIPKKTGGLLSFLKFDRPDLYGLYHLADKTLTEDQNWQKFAGTREVAGNIYWSGIADRYFLFALLPQDVQGPVKAQFGREKDNIVNQLYANELIVAPQQKKGGHFLAYVGPKQLSYLERVSSELKRAVDYGWFSIIAVLILKLMSFLHRFIPSWGLTIITLTFIVKMLLHPFNKKSMQSMKAMQNLQPKLNEIKKKYGDDKQKQNEETMQLFRTHKVNPMGGCLPMLLQFPVYIALYKVLWNAIELYHAPFLGIYADLSAPDPYFVSPILLGVFMFLQQKLTPTASVDPAQQKMMMFMPVMFTVMMLFLPVGLVVYIFVNTAMSVVQQYMMKHDLSFRDVLRGRFKPQTAQNSQ